MRTLHPTASRSSKARIAITLVALTLTACTSAAPAPTSVPPKPAAATSAPAATAAPAAAPSPSAAPAALPTGPATVKAVVNSSVATSILADATGRTLYMLTTDKDKTSACYDNCERLWPPLLTQGAPIAGDGATAARLRDGVAEQIKRIPVKPSFECGAQGFIRGAI